MALLVSGWTQAGDMPWTPSLALAQAEGTDEVRELVSRISDDSLIQSRRDEAARKLVGLAGAGASEVRGAVTNLLVNAGNRGGQLAVARALVLPEAGPGQDESLIPLLYALIGTDRQLTEAAAEALGYYRTSTQVINLLTAFATATDKPEPSRAAVIRAMGSFVDKRVAQTLIEQIQSRSQSSVIKSAASDALETMTGLAKVGNGIGEWTRWWEEAAKLDDDAFRTQILLSRASRLDQLQTRYAELSDELLVLLSEGYRLTPDAQKGDRLLGLLQSAQPAIRVAAVRIVTNDALENRSVPTSARELLRHMVADPSPEVRMEAVIAIRSMNDSAALDPLLTQLARERVPMVRASMAQTLGPMRNIRAVRPLLGLLGDRYVKVSEASAESLAALGTEIRKDRALSDEVASALRIVLERPTDRETEGLKGAALEALVPLRRRDMLPMVQQLLGSTDSTRIKRAALRVMAELHEPDTAVSIIAALDGSRNEAGVRLEAITALGAIPTFEHAETLFRRISPDVEPDATVRAQAWTVLSELFPLATRDQLLAWSERFIAEPDRRIVVLRALAAKLSSIGDEEALALTHQQIGETLLKLNQTMEAIRPLEQALKYWRDRKVSNMFTESLYQLTIDALLRGRLFPEAASFAAQSISDHEANQQTMGTRLIAEVRSLVELEDLASAASLLNEIQRMRPSLAPRYQEEFIALGRIVRDGLGPTPSTIGGTTRPTTQP